MQRKTLLLWGLIFLVVACKNDEILPSLQNSECHGSSMIGTWSIVDSLEFVYSDFDSTQFFIYNSEMTFYEDGKGKWDVPSSSDDVFFTWILQCEPNLFTMSIPVNNTDSLFHPSELYSVLPYKILVNELNYKKLKRESVANTNQYDRTRISIWEMTKIE